MLVLQRPASVFAAMRREDEQELRQEPLLAIIFLAGIAGVLSTNLAGACSTTSRSTRSGSRCGRSSRAGSTGSSGYFVLGALLFIGEKSAGADTSYVRSRHVLGYACVPLALSLLAQPVKIAAYGEDAFKSGGSDTGFGAHVFEAIELVALVWCAVLLVIGVRTVNSWSWWRALAARCRHSHRPRSRSRAPTARSSCGGATRDSGDSSRDSLAAGNALFAYVGSVPPRGVCAAARGRRQAPGRSPPPRASRLERAASPWRRRGHAPRPRALPPRRRPVCALTSASARRHRISFTRKSDGAMRSGQREPPGLFKLPVQSEQTRKVCRND